MCPYWCLRSNFRKILYSHFKPNSGNKKGQTQGFALEVPFVQCSCCSLQETQRQPRLASPESALGFAWGKEHTEVRQSCVHSSGEAAFSSCFILTINVTADLGNGFSNHGLRGEPALQFLNSLPLFSAWKVGLRSLCADVLHDVRSVSARLVQAFGVAGEGSAQV